MGNEIRVREREREGGGKMGSKREREVMNISFIFLRDLFKRTYLKV